MDTFHIYFNEEKSVRTEQIYFPVCINKLLSDTHLLKVLVLHRMFLSLNHFPLETMAECPLFVTNTHEKCKYFSENVLKKDEIAESFIYFTFEVNVSN